MKTYYAIRRKKDGQYWTRTGSPTPALFLTAPKAHSTVKQNYYKYVEDEWEIVAFKEQDES